MAPEGTIGLVDYALAALLRLGGDASVVDLEDIAVEAHRLAPERFRWRRHDFPNLELVRVVLSDANKRGNHWVLYDRKGRKLTVEGARRAATVLQMLQAEPSAHHDDTLRRQDLTELARMESHPAYERWRLGGMSAIDIVDLADLVRCAASTPPKQFSDRLRNFEAMAAHWHRDDLARFIGQAADDLPRLIAEEHR